MSLLMSLVQRVLARKALRYVAEFFEAAKQPAETQRAWLLNRLERARNTGFGRDHHFASIRTIDDYRRHVPIAGYEYAEPYIERVKNGETQALFDRERVLMFALTSGTSSARKFIPVTPQFVDDYRRGWTMWGLGAFWERPHLLLKSKLTLASDPDEFRTAAGIPCGSISGLTANMQNAFVRRTYCLPPQSSQLHDLRAKSYLAWRLGVMCDLGMWVSPNPSTHVQLARFGDQCRESLIRDVHNGTVDPEMNIPTSVLRSKRGLLRANPTRARQLEQIVERTGHLRPKDVWPNLNLIGCWLGGTLGAYLRHFPEYFGDAGVRDIGLIASESRMTIPKEDRTPGGILEITSGFFEFIPVEEIDSPQPTVLLAHELQEGRDYWILLTTSSGLYRYNISDVVRCTGWHDRTPILAFLHKGAHIASITGEKLSEYQAAKAVEGALAALDHRLHCYSLVPCWSDELPYYGLLIEDRDARGSAFPTQLAGEVDRRLRELNCEYDTKRSSERLGPVRVLRLPDHTWEEWDRARMARNGGTAEQYKHPALIPDLDFVATMPVIDEPVRLTTGGNCG